MDGNAMATELVKTWLMESGMKADDVRVVGRGGVYLSDDAIENAVKHYRDRGMVNEAKRILTERARQHHEEARLAN